VKQLLPYGTWPSPITAESTTRSRIRFADVIRVDGDDLYWVESRPQEAGRSVVVKLDGSGRIGDIGPEDFNARTSAHEYGGGAYAVAGGVAFASRFEDQRIHRIDPEGESVAVTPEPSSPRSDRYADLAIRWPWAIGVRERHDTEGEPANELARIDLTGSTEPEVVASGHDFYSSPRISPDGSTLAWVTWDHPNMPWDGTDLWTAPLSGDGDLGDPEHRAGGPSESVVLPEWDGRGRLHFVSDRTGWWNLYRKDGDGDTALYPAESEFGTPGWTFGRRRYLFLADGRLVALHGPPHGEHLAVLEDGELRDVPLPYAAFASTMEAAGTTVYLIGHAADRPSAVIGVDVDTGNLEVIRAPEGPGIDPGLISAPEAISCPTPEGRMHSLFYAPTNPGFQGPEGELPPLIVDIHGGPTSSAIPELDPDILYWTSRGFGVVDVNYGGSTGYGRAYRERLSGQWGIVDVRDCGLVASYLGEIGRADPDRLLIHGSSAGGYTTLLALALTDEFAAGTSRYGVADLSALAEHTHKFESRYLDSLVGPYPEAKQIYDERSPLTHIDSLERPVLLLQGTEDKVVPQEQSDMIYEALRANGVPVAYILFAGEGHGFRGSEARVKALEAELSFYGQVLGFEPADDIEPVEIDNL
jgi:dipeptidyl aminopeptidase/acylaminoacyl peptidase